MYVENKKKKKGDILCEPTHELNRAKVVICVCVCCYVVRGVQSDPQKEMWNERGGYKVRKNIMI